MKKISKNNKPRVLFEQYVIPHYRVPFFRELAKNVDLLVLASNNRKVDGLNDIKKKLPFNSVRLSENTTLPVFHSNLFDIIDKFHPDVYISAEYALDRQISDKEVYSKLRKSGLKILWMGCDGYLVKHFYFNLILSLLGRQTLLHTLRQIYVMSKVDGFISYSSHTAEYLHKSRFVPKRKIQVAHNSVETEQLNKIYRKWISTHEKRDPQRIVFTGRLTEGKRVDLLLEAFSGVLKKYNNAKLDIIGDGSKSNDLKKLSQKLKLGKSVQFHGPIYSDVKLAKKMCPASLFVMPGLGGLGFNTAMAIGLPIIYTHADGTEADIITDGYNGWYFNGTVKDLQKKIEIALSNPKKLLLMGKRSERRIVKEFNIRNMVKAYLNAINNVLH